MKVRLINNWFVNSVSHSTADKRVFSGRLYKRGVHVIPDELKGKLPKSAEIIEDVDDYEAPVVEEDVKEEASLRDFDEERTAQDEVEATVKRKVGRPRKAE